MTSKVVSAWSSCGAVDDLRQQHLRASAETRGTASQECPVLPHDERRAGGRPVHDSDSYMPTESHELVRVLGGAATPCPAGCRQSAGMDAVVLPDCPWPRVRHISLGRLAVTHPCRKLTVATHQPRCERSFRLAQGAYR